MILVLFASKSDEETYTRIATGLKKHGIEYELRIASAHKTPDKAEEIIKKNYSLIISGAGLAAALPGVIAARKMTPVIGVPCPGAYDGLDSFLSIVQMPPGIPVLACQKEEAAYETGKILERKTKVEDLENPEDKFTPTKPGGINFTSADLNYISTCNPSNGLEVVMKGIEANATAGNVIINITNATIQATDAFLTSLIIPNHNMWVTMDTKPGNGFAWKTGDVSSVDSMLKRTKVKGENL